MFKCENCGREFKTETGLNNHKKNCQKEEVVNEEKEEVVITEDKLETEETPLTMNIPFTMKEMSFNDVPIVHDVKEEICIKESTPIIEDDKVDCPYCHQTMKKEALVKHLQYCYKMK